MTESAAETFCVTVKEFARPNVWRLDRKLPRRARTVISEFGRVFPKDVAASSWQPLLGLQRNCCW